MPSKQKSKNPVKRMILIAFIVCATAFVIGVTFFATPQSPKESSAPTAPNYNKLMESALSNYQDAQSALIYKDVDKAQILLKEAEDSLQKIDSKANLYEDAQKLLGQIKEKKVEVEKAAAEQTPNE